jgi:hypothetical protein
VKYQLLLFGLLLWANTADKPEPIAVHVREVQRVKGDVSKKGTWFHVTASVESMTVVYSLTCDEYFNSDLRDYTRNCSRLSAGQDYQAVKVGSAMNFWPNPSSNRSNRLALYKIVSEKGK